MSTKIWVAYKLKNTDKLWELIRDIRITAKDNVKKELTNLYLKLEPNIKTDTDLFKSLLETHRGNERQSRFHLLQKEIRRGYRYSTTSIYKDFFDFNVSVTFRCWKNKIYLIPYCDGLRNVLDFLKDDKRLVDFHYQNQVDRPDNISNKVWEQRKVVWDEIIDGGYWKDMLILDICSWESFGDVDPGYELMHAKVK